MAFAENMEVFFNPAEFASVIMLNGVAVNGIFDDDYFEPVGNVATGTQPRILIAMESIPSIARGQTVVVNGGNFKVCGIEPPRALWPTPAYGTVTVLLERQ